MTRRQRATICNMQFTICSIQRVWYGGTNLSAPTGTIPDPGAAAPARAHPAALDRAGAGGSAERGRRPAAALASLGRLGGRPGDVAGAWDAQMARRSAALRAADHG